MTHIPRLPALTVSAAGLQAYLRMPEGLGLGREALGARLGVSPSVLTRYLQELQEEGLLLRERRGSYWVPRQPARRLLLGESSAYHRELLLLHDVFTMRHWGHAFACVPVRDAMTMELPHPVMVLPLNHEVTAEDDPGLGIPQLAWMNHPPGVHDLRVPFPGGMVDSPASLKVPVLPDAWALAVFAATADPDFIRAAATAASAMEVRWSEVRAIASKLRVEVGRVQRTDDNLLVHARWLRPRILAARRTLARRTLQELLASAGAD